MKASEGIKQLIQKYEGLRLKAYLCPANVPTIGYGSTIFDGKPVKLGMVITKEQAKEQFDKDLEKFESGVTRLLNITLKQNQFDALVSFAYNCGIGNLQKSTLLKLVNKNPNNPSIRAEFAKWNKGGGKVLAGLVKRRAEEADWYFS